MILLTAGHQGPGTGAQSKYLDEGTEAIILRDLITAELKKVGVKVWNDADRMPLRSVLATIRRWFGANDILVEIHFNSALLSNATGTECFVRDAATKQEYQIAQSISNITANILGIRNRGVKTAVMSQHQRLALLEDTKTTAVLWEVCFGNNPADVQKYLNHRPELVKAFAEYLTRISK